MVLSYFILRLGALGGVWLFFCPSKVEFLDGGGAATHIESLVWLACKYIFFLGRRMYPNRVCYGSSIVHWTTVLAVHSYGQYTMES